jgi:hypothetical protein
MTDPEFDTYVANASAALERKQQHLETAHGIGRWVRFFVDYEGATLRFFDGDALRVEAGIVPVGTHALASNVFQWAWANTQFPPHVRADAERLKSLYDLTGFDFFRNERGSSDEAMAWQTTAIACEFLQAHGAYRVPHGSVHSYVLITAIRSVA